MRLISQDAPVNLWDNKEMKLDEITIGLKGSPTQVRKIFSPERAKGEIIGDGVNNPQEAAYSLLDKLIEKDIVYL